jgi:hypothetical protein
MDTQSKYRIVADVISLCDENDRLREQVRTIESAFLDGDAGALVREVYNARLAEAVKAVKENE